MDLNGKAIVVTGATSGIGLAVAEELARGGAFVIGAARSPERCAATERRLRELSPAGLGRCLVADLAVQGQVRLLAASVGQTLASEGRSYLDGLVNNAGTFTYWLTYTAEGFEMQWAVNHLAGFLLTRELLPLLLEAPAARVVTVSSASHYGARVHWEDVQLRRRYNGLRAYGQSKLANILFTLELNRRYGAGTSLRAFAADPGLVRTGIGGKGTPALVRWVWNRRSAAGISADESARGIVALLAEPDLDSLEQVYWKHGRPQTPSRRALDGADAVRLWELSETMCGLKEEAR